MGFSSAIWALLLGSFCSAPWDSFRLTWCLGLAPSASLHTILLSNIFYNCHEYFCYHLSELLDLIFEQSIGLPSQFYWRVLWDNLKIFLGYRGLMQSGHRGHLSHRGQAWGLHLTGHCGDGAPTLSSSGLKQRPLEITFYFPCGEVLSSFILSLNPALGAYCSDNSWNRMKEYLFIQGAFQGHRKTFEVTLFLFNSYVWVFSRILRNALCKRLKPLLTALSSAFWCSVQITPSTSNQIASQEKISLGMK